MLAHYRAAYSALPPVGVEGARQTIALTLALGLWVALTAVAYDTAGLVGLWRIQTDAREAREGEEVLACRAAIRKRGLFLLVIAAVLVPLVRWDVALLQPRDETLLFAESPAIPPSAFLALSLNGALMLLVIGARVKDAWDLLAVAYGRWRSV